MKQRLALTQAFMEDPNVLLLDEPFNELDDEYRSVLVGDVARAKNQGKIVVIAIHRDSQVENGLYDKIFRLNNGKIAE